MIEVFETNNTVSIVLDLIEGGELFQQVSSLEIKFLFFVKDCRTWPFQ